MNELLSLAFFLTLKDNCKHIKASGKVVQMLYFLSRKSSLEPLLYFLACKCRGVFVFSAIFPAFSCALPCFVPSVSLSMRMHAGLRFSVTHLLATLYYLHATDAAS